MRMGQVGRKAADGIDREVGCGWDKRGGRLREGQVRRQAAGGASEEESFCSAGREEDSAHFSPPGSHRRSW